MLVESVVTMFIVGILATAIYSGINLSLSTIRSARENLRATQVMVEKTEAIRLYWESVEIDRSPSSMLREIEVELPA